MEAHQFWSTLANGSSGCSIELTNCTGSDLLLQRAQDALPPLTIPDDKTVAFGTESRRALIAYSRPNAPNRPVTIWWETRFRAEPKFKIATTEPSLYAVGEVIKFKNFFRLQFKIHSAEQIPVSILAEMDPPATISNTAGLTVRNVTDWLAVRAHVDSTAAFLGLPPPERIPPRSSLQTIVHDFNDRNAKGVNPFLEGQMTYNFLQDKTVVGAVTLRWRIPPWSKQIEFTASTEPKEAPFRLRFQSLEPNAAEWDIVVEKTAASIPEAETQARAARHLVAEASIRRLIGRDTGRVPTVALACSGGGMRACMGTIGGLAAFSDSGLLDCLTDVAALSGSSWPLAMWLSLPLNPFYENADPWAASRTPGDERDLEGEGKEGRPGNSTDTEKNKGPLDPEPKFPEFMKIPPPTANTSLLDLYSLFLHHHLLSGHNAKFSAAQEKLVTGRYPMLTCTAATVWPIDSLHSRYNLVEFTPWSVRESGTGRAITTDRFSREQDHEAPLHELMAIWGSAFLADAGSVLRYLGIKTESSTTPLINAQTYECGDWRLRDAGVDVNVPFGAVPKDVDLLLVLDCSGGAKNAAELQRAIDFGYVEDVFPNPLSEFQGTRLFFPRERSSKQPIIVYCLVLNDLSTFQFGLSRAQQKQLVISTRKSVTATLVPKAIEAIQRWWQANNPLPPWLTVEPRQGNPNRAALSAYYEARFLDAEKLSGGEGFQTARIDYQPSSLHPGFPIDSLLRLSNVLHSQRPVSGLRDRAQPTDTMISLKGPAGSGKSSALKNLALRQKDPTFWPEFSALVYVNLTDLARRIADLTAPLTEDAFLDLLRADGLHLPAEHVSTSLFLLDSFDEVETTATDSLRLFVELLKHPHRRAKIRHLVLALRPECKERFSAFQTFWLRGFDLPVALDFAQGFFASHCKNLSPEEQARRLALTKRFLEFWSAGGYQLSPLLATYLVECINNRAEDLGSELVSSRPDRLANFLFVIVTSMINQMLERSLTEEPDEVLAQLAKHAFLLAQSYTSDQRLVEFEVDCKAKVALQLKLSGVCYDAGPAESLTSFRLQFADAALMQTLAARWVAHSTEATTRLNQFHSLELAMFWYALAGYAGSSMIEIRPVVAKSLAAWWCARLPTDFPLPRSESVRRSGALFFVTVLTVLGASAAQLFLDQISPLGAATTYLSYFTKLKEPPVGYQLLAEAAASLGNETILKRLLGSLKFTEAHLVPIHRAAEAWHSLHSWLVQTHPISNAANWQ